MRKLLRALILIAFSIAMVAHAAVEEPDFFELKAKLEEILTKKYRNRLSARLPLELFSVGAQVTLENEKDIKKRETIEPNKILKDGPIDPTNIGGFGFGSFSSMPSGQKDKVDPLRELKITKIEVFVGLSPKLSDEDKKKFTSWLKANVQREYGEIGSLTVNELPSVVKESDKSEAKAPELKFDKPIEVTLNPAAKPRALNFEERFGYFQNLIGLISLALIILIAAIASKLMLSRDVKEQTAVSLKIQELKSEAAQHSGPRLNESASRESSTSQENSSDSGLNPNLVYESYRDLQKKAAFLALSYQKKITIVVDMWYDEGNDGRCKLAAIIDCVLSHLGTSKAEVVDFSFDWSLTEKARNDKSLSAVFRSYGAMSLSEKSEILERAYWDLLGAKALGEHMIKQRFTSLSGLPAPVIQRVLSAQDKKARSVTMLHLIPEKLAQIAGGMSIEDKQAVVDQAFESATLSEIELDVVDQTLTSLIKRETMMSEDLVEVPKLVPGLLAVLKPQEEIQIVRELTSRRPDAAEFLKATYASIAFLGEWPKDKLKSALNGARPAELLALLQVMPDLTESVLDSVPARTRAMLKEDIGKKKLATEEVDESLELIRLRVSEMIETGEMNLSKTFGKAKPQGPQGIAA